MKAIKRTMLLLNIVIGLATVFMVNQLNQLVPGGKFYQEVVTIDIVRSSVNTTRRDIQSLLDEYVACKSGQYCLGLTDTRQRVQKTPSKYTNAIHRAVPQETQDYLAALVVQQQDLDRRITSYLDTNPALNSEFILRTAEFRRENNSLAQETHDLLVKAGENARQRVRDRVEFLQFIFVVIMISVWAFSALLTDIFLIRKGGPNVDRSPAPA